MLEKTYFKRSFELFKKHFSYKGKSGASKIKSSTKNLTSVIHESFVLEIYFEIFYFGISIELISIIVEIKNKITTSFKSLVSKSSRTLRLKRPQGIGKNL